MRERSYPIIYVRCVDVRDGYCFILSFHGLEPHELTDGLISTCLHRRGYPIWFVRFDAWELSQELVDYRTKHVPREYIKRGITA